MQITKLSSAGGLAARIARPVQPRASEEYSPDDALKVSTQAVEILFGSTRAAVLRVGDIPLVMERQREYKARSAQAKDLRSQGKAVPRDFCPDTFFFTFQHQRDTILAKAPISVRDVGQVAWMSSKWTVASADDMTREAEFAQIFVTADTFKRHLQQFEQDLSVNPLITVSQTLRADFLQLQLRFSAVRERYVARTVAAGLKEARLHHYHAEFRYLLRAYTHDHETLEDFMTNVWTQLVTQSYTFDSVGEREGYFSRAFVCIARAFLTGLRNGPPPSGLNWLDSSISRNDGDDAKTMRAMMASQAATSRTPAEFPATTSSTVYGSPMAAFSTQRLCDQAPPTVTESAPSADVMARQTAAGFRAPGALLGGLFGGSAEGIDLSDVARRVLFAHQMLAGMRAPGSLVSSPPAGELPSVASYGPAIAQPPPPAYAGPAPPPCQGTQYPSPYTTVQRPVAGPVGGGGGGSTYSTQRTQMIRGSDDLYIPRSTSLLGSYTPYRGFSLPQSLTCFECNAWREHYANECPARFVRVRGEAPPGWKVERGSGAVVKDQDAWNGPELKDAARARYRDFLGKFGLVPHTTQPVTVEDITGPAPPAPRRALPRPSSGGRYQ